MYRIAAFYKFGSPTRRLRLSGKSEETTEILTVAAAAATGDEIVTGREEVMEGANGVGGSECERKPLSEVVGDCVQRWFQDAFKEARKGDIANQVLVAQMFFSGYGVPKNEYKGRQWMDRASRFRSSALKVGMKRPGYNASDSDSDEANDDANQ
ncbi:hypothetical protein C2845_PM05G20430 [Panicum miliaceum]|uniref:Uncharacterized protein n=1 Tax=Panicum miliaceum TaxID=4540 RepID=A0A3L6SYG4_PANMI|nr:hypothetical protein C2845_PM05G20430 [Panicum miliaceum]